MHSPEANGRPKGCLNISDVGPRFGSKKVAAAIIRCALTVAVLSALLLIAARPAQAQTETVLYNFTGGADGNVPAGITPDGAGNFYGATLLGGSCPGWNQRGCGVVYELSPNGSGGWNQTVLHTFSAPPDGANADAPLLFDSKGNIYGDTMYGGAYNSGAVFEMSRVGGSWTESVLYSSGGLLASGIMMDPAGNIYGTTRYGPGGLGQGPVFELSPSSGGWTETVLAYTTDTSGCTPYAGLTMDAAGNIFGATCKTVFELSPNGNGGWNLTVIHTFTGAPNDGDTAWGTPVLDKAGNLYGTTEYGGAKNYGTVYKLSPGENGEWTEEILYSFMGGKDGTTPYTGIVFDAAGNIYGTTVYGGASNDGTVYELVALVGTGSYKEKVLWNFNGADGNAPVGLILDNTGNLYGTTALGGSSNAGVVFELVNATVVDATAVVKPTTLTFGPQRLQTTSPAKRISLFNNGPLPITVTSVNLQGDFAVSANKCQNGVQPDTHCDIYVTFMPTGTGTGPRTGIITFVDTAFNRPQSARLSGTVGVSKTLVTTSGSPSFVGQPVTFTATVTSAQGKIPDGELVTFYDGTTTLGSVALASGTAAFTTSSLSVREHIIKATYAGDAAFDPSAGDVMQVVDKNPTTTTLTSSLNPSNYGQAVTLTATVTSAGSAPTGTVTFKSGSVILGSGTLNASGVATLTTKEIPVGANSLTSTYNGDAFNGKSVSAAITQTVSQASISMVLTSTPNPSTFGTSVKFTAKLTSNGGLPTWQPVTFSYNGATLGTANVNSSSVATFYTTALPRGADLVTAAYAGTVDYSSASATVTQVVN